MITIKTFKFESNLAFVSSYLKEQHIPHFADLKTKSLLSDEKTKYEILKIIEDLKIDEADVEPDREILEGYKEWNENMYNPGYYTGGKSPSFSHDKSNYLTLGFVTLLSGLACCVELIYGDNFSKTFFWIMVGIISLISFSFFYQYFKYKKRNSN
ncbi:hypothetical protein EG359_03655 [Chryseobacterium joostei]|uniref:Uncharacterized protein n=1 Tax=Chryseobacterium joostei TaxID=112234 RepID=A0A1N7HXJ2_9FLAO|nr:hypothetical protein [Chryseobacterium joostei]AZA98757.1 hypothetical protein EG359_03655 [Chryseobacterium joostei]SIS29481.1 hypothetical protein SAMN05421768_101631 [Chryseobacterium joostei]